MNLKSKSPSTIESDSVIETTESLNVSFVIPVLNEGDRVADSIAKAWLADADEVIVVDGGSVDQTVAAAQASNCRLVRSTPGRGQQLNAGAAIATGDILLFLHVDNWLDAGAAEQMRNALKDENCIGGGFKQRIESQRLIFRIVEFGNFIRAKSQRLVYGDQGLFVRRNIFESLGGYPEIPLMEDFVFSQTLFKRRCKPMMLPGPLHVDPRRWEKTGVLRQTLKNWRIATAFRFGTSPESLYRRYYQD